MLILWYCRRSTPTQIFFIFFILININNEFEFPQILSYIDKEKYCGYQIPSPITSVSNVMEVWFRTDASVERSGFRATYSSVLSKCLVFVLIFVGIF